MSTLLVLGRSGQLAQALARRGAGQFHGISFAGRSVANMETPGAAARHIRAVRPDIVINAAAYTAVDKAETEAELAFRINGTAAGEAAEAANEIDARFIQVSTDYVFGETGPPPLAEDATPAPLNAYGRSKLAGERAVSAAHSSAAIVRTAAVFSGRGKDFPSAIWRKAKAGEVISVVADQYTCPTFADDLADRLIALAKREDASGVFHCVGTPGVNWHGFAEEALALYHKAGGPLAQLRKISYLAFKSPAERPADSRLSSRRLENMTELAKPDWRLGLQSALDVWLSQG